MSLKDYFGFNKKERIGISALIVLLLIVFAGYLFLPDLLPPTPKMSDKEFKEQVETFIHARKAEEKRLKTLREEEKNASKTSNIRQSTVLTPFDFNPNNLPTEKWKEIGFSDKQISIIHNYEKSGGEFRKKTDLRRIYGIDEKEYAQLEPYIKIPEAKQKKEPDESTSEIGIRKEKAEPLVIALNKTDSLELMKVNGIGPVFSSRIIKFRDYLGGYYSKSQLLEVYGLDTTRYAQINQHFTVDSSLVKTINLNTATFKELLAHPYLDYYLVKEITKYRETHGPFENLEELKNISLVYDELYKKIIPYLIIR